MYNKKKKKSESQPPRKWISYSLVVFTEAAPPKMLYMNLLWPKVSAYLYIVVANTGIVLCTTCFIILLDTMIVAVV